MRVHLGPSGLRAFWQVLDADRLESWLERQPWVFAEPPFVAWLPRRESVGSVILEGARKLFALQPGNAWWTNLNAFPANATDLRPVLAAWAEIAPRSDREFADALGASLLHRPRVFVAELRSPSTLAACRESLARLTELTQKLRGVPLCFLLAVSSTDHVDLGVTRLDVAWPEVLRRLPTEDDRWAAYLHERVAWHVSGRLDDAVQVFEGTTKLERGDDRALESVLGEHARHRFAAIHERTRRSLAMSLAALEDHIELCVPSVIPGAGDARRPMPWLARAILLEHPNHPQRRFLRAAVTCRPMAMRLLGRCIDLEARIKDVAVDYLAANVTIPAEHNRETVEAFRRIHGQLPGVESTLIPPGHPLPDLEWEMASLGTIEKFARNLVPNATSTVRRVRNALAHGSPVGWGAFNLMERLEAAVCNSTV